MNLKEYIYSILVNSTRFREVLRLFFPRSLKLQVLSLKSDFLIDYIKSYYNKFSLEEKCFYNIGAGDQRSKYDFWSYVDLEESKYSKSGIDVFYDLESLDPMPITSDTAELIFSSFVLEHISQEATKNFCKESFRSLKDGGVFHAKVHCYDYSYRLLKHGLLSPKIPFENRESLEALNKFIVRHKGKIKAGFENGNYVVTGLNNDKLIFSPKTSFLYHNATASIANIEASQQGIDGTFEELEGVSVRDFYASIKNKVDDDKKQPHQHNADYFSKEDLRSYLLDIGFSEVYFTQPYQSVSPALWEDQLNPMHSGFLYSIEAIK